MRNTPDGVGLRCTEPDSGRHVGVGCLYPWLTVIQLPAYAPDLNPVEGAWSVMKNQPGNLAPGTTDQLAGAMRHQLDRIQRQPGLITGFLGQTGFTLDSQPP